MKIEQEPFAPCRETVALIETAASKILPDSAALEQWFRNYVTYHKGRIAFDLELIQGHVGAGARVLEVGSLPLLLTAALKESQYDVCGLDIAPERFGSSITQLGLNVIKCDVEREPLPMADASYDAVIFNELLEHLRINPVFTMKEIFRVMNPGATLLISTPNLKSLAGFINFLFRDCAYSCEGDLYQEYLKLETLGHMGHVREYTRTEVIRFLERIGFAVEKLIYRGDYPSRKRRLTVRLFKKLRPFITYVARKPE